jgi:hypothetical protein
MGWKQSTASFLAALVALPLAGAPAAAQIGPEEYAAKFVCGSTPRATIVMPGAYATAVNVHNPRDPRDEIRWKVALAGALVAGKVSAFDRFALRNDEALDIDCRFIARRLAASGIAVPTIAYTGFVVIQSAGPLDVVAVYTAANLTSTNVPGQVVSIHTERVPPRPLRD